MPETGNKNVFTTFKGKYELTMFTNQTTDNTAIMLSCTNDVQFLGNVVLSGYLLGDPFATVAEECRPNKAVIIPVVLSTETETTVITMQCDIYGQLSLDIDVDSGVLHLNGVSFHISDCWY